MNRFPYFIAILVLVVLAVVGYFWLQRPMPQQQGIAPIEAPAPISEPPPAEPPTPEIEHPIEPPAASPGDPSAADDSKLDLGVALSTLVGRDRLLSFLNIDEFAHRFVATVDNLARPHAAPAVWPVHPTPNRFMVEGDNERQVISSANSLRYKAFITFVESVDTDRAVSLYTRLYPRFQQAYENLGYPRSYFNDRLVAVIDHLLATPEPGEPVGVHLTEVKGPVPTQRPWVRYEYTNPDFEARSAGQKMLLRMGSANRQALKAKLAAIRSKVTSKSPIQ